MKLKLCSDSSFTLVTKWKIDSLAWPTAKTGLQCYRNIQANGLNRVYLQYMYIKSGILCSINNFCLHCFLYCSRNSDMIPKCWDSVCSLTEWCVIGCGWVSYSIASFDIRAACGHHAFERGYQRSSCLIFATAQRTRDATELRSLPGIRCSSRCCCCCCRSNKDAVLAAVVWSAYLWRQRSQYMSACVRQGCAEYLL